MAKKGVIPSESAFNRFSESTKHFESTYRDQPKKGEKPTRTPRNCRHRNEIWKLKVTGTPTGGSFDIDVTVKSSQETLTINYNWTAAQVKTEFATHSELASGDLSTSGGPFPGSEIIVQFQGSYAKKLMYDSDSNAPVIDDSSLTGGTSPAAWLIPMTPGYPGNANP